MNGGVVGVGAEFHVFEAMQLLGHESFAGYVAFIFYEYLCRLYYLFATVGRESADELAEWLYVWRERFDGELWALYECAEFHALSQWCGATLGHESLYLSRGYGEGVGEVDDGIAQPAFFFEELHAAVVGEA